MPTSKQHNWQHDGEYCHHKHQDEAGEAARSVCEGMYEAKNTEIEILKEALRAVYARAGEDPVIRDIVKEALDKT